MVFRLWLYKKKREAAQQAQALLERNDAVIWDTETTDIDDPRLVSLAAIDTQGRVLFDALFDPQMPIPPGATNVHGIIDDMVVGQPLFLERYAELRNLLHERSWIGYNVEFDAGVLASEHSRLFYGYGNERSRCIRPSESHCVMKLYARFWGAWSERHGSFTWQKLQDACWRLDIHVDALTHSALGDCLRTLGVLRAMSDWLVQQENPS